MACHHHEMRPPRQQCCDSARQPGDGVRARSSPRDIKHRFGRVYGDHLDALGSELDREYASPTPQVSYSIGTERRDQGNVEVGAPRPGVLQVIHRGKRRVCVGAVKDHDVLSARRTQPFGDRSVT